MLELLPIRCITLSNQSTSLSFSLKVYYEVFNLITTQNNEIVRNNGFTVTANLSNTCTYNEIKSTYLPLIIVVCDIVEYVPQNPLT